MHRQSAIRVAFFARTAGVVRDTELALGVKFFEQTTSILEQSLAQSKLDGFAVANPVALEILARQPQEGLGFLELFVRDFLRLEFFFLSVPCPSSRVSSSLSVTYSSASDWKRR
jgi:hypothetical protein